MSKNARFRVLSLTLLVVGFSVLAEGQSAALLGKPGGTAQYTLSDLENPPASVVKTVIISLGNSELVNRVSHQWIFLEATKVDGKQFRLWMLSSGLPSPNLDMAKTMTALYIFQEGDSKPLDYRDRFSGRAVLPSSGGWPYMFPRSTDTPDELFPDTSQFLGHTYTRGRMTKGNIPTPPSRARLVELLPEILVGVPINTRQKDETRRYDNSDYEYISLTEDDYREMIEEGLNCFRVDPDTVDWFVQADVFYYGVGGADVPYPECFYQSQYLGSSLYLNEPGVVTRDHILRTRLREDPEFRKSISPEIAMKAFEEHFENDIRKGPPRGFITGLGAREDVDLGAMDFSQRNIHSWDTTFSSAAYQLTQDPQAPGVFVFEPPGDVGTRRTLPEMNMTYGCQIPINESNNLIDIIIGFIRGAARVSQKEWGISVYGEFAPADAGWFMTHAYDMGATRFFFWNNSQLACVPHGEVLALVHNLQTHAKRNPNRDLKQLRQAAEVAILLPPGYTLGHVYLGKGPLWGIGELNLERRNRAGITYRQVMGNFFTEIERCLRLGVAFDLVWDLPELNLDGYREIVRVREDGKVEISNGSENRILDQARAPSRPEGAAPKLDIQLSADTGSAPLKVTATAMITETSAPVFYTLGPDSKGIEQNTMAAWELYGPNDEDYTYLRAKGPVHLDEKGRHIVETVLRLKDSGRYRLRVATVDEAGRSTVVWKDITVE